MEDKKIEKKTIITPLSDEVVKSLRAGDEVLISGAIYTARDTAHKRMMEILDKHEKLPFDIKGQLIYYAGLTPTRPGKVIGSIGPTSSVRMNPYAPRLLQVGAKGMIGKGEMDADVQMALQKYTAIYLAAVGGAAALIAQTVVKDEPVAWEELGTEAIRKLTVKDFPAIVVQDCYGGNLFQEGVKKYTGTTKDGKK